MYSVNEYRFRLNDHFTGEVLECTTLRTVYKYFDSKRREYKGLKAQDDVLKFKLELIDQATEETLEMWEHWEFPTSEEFWEHIWD